MQRVDEIYHVTKIINDLVTCLENVEEEARILECFVLVVYFFSFQGNIVIQYKSRISHA